MTIQPEKKRMTLKGGIAAISEGKRHYF